MVVGPAGAGKTTLSKRVVLSTFQNNNFAFFIPLAFIDPQKPIDLKYLIFTLGLLYFPSEIKITENQLNVAFAWLLTNQHKVTIIIDGLDQARFTLQSCKAPTDVDVHKKYSASELLYMILARKVLPEVRLILTSRQHSILNFEINIRSKYVLYLDDLSEDDMKKLFCFYIKDEEVERVLNKLSQMSPKIQQLTFCPLYFRLFCLLYEMVGFEIFELLKSTANLFHELLIRLHNCAHKGSQLVLTNLSKLAYNKTMEGSVVITQEDLLEYQITPNEVINTMIGVHIDANSALAGPSLFYFAHQSIQVSRLNFCYLMLS